MRTLVTVSVCVVALLGLAGTACASTLSVSNEGVLRLAARPGEMNRVTLGEGPLLGGWGYTVGDSAGLTAGRGCTQVSATQAQCLLGGLSDPALGGLDIHQIVLDLGNRGDTSNVFTSMGFAGVEVRGGAGDDVLSGGAVVPTSSPYTVDGGPGDDVIDRVATNGDPVDIDGGPGDDTVSTSGTVGSGSMRGGLGADTFIIRGQVFATIDGGPGPDTITGVETNGRPPTIGQTILGGFGRDTIDGLGASSIDCGPGLDSYVVYDGQTTTGCETPLP